MRMAIVDQVSGEVLLQNEDLRKTLDGAAAQAAAGFLCTMVEPDGTRRTKEVSSVQECLDYAGISTSRTVSQGAYNTSLRRFSVLG